MPAAAKRAQKTRAAVTDGAVSFQQNCPGCPELPSFIGSAEHIFSSFSAAQATKHGPACQIYHHRGSPQQTVAHLRRLRGL